MTRRFFITWLILVCTGSLFTCQKSISKDPIPPYDTFDLQSSVLEEKRVICVWKPIDYSTSQDSLPVLYMPDGGIHEDFPHIANTISDLVRRGELEPMLVVGIENTERRRDLTGPTKIATDKEIAPLTGDSAKFRQFIGTELFPEIERRYKVDNRRAIIGESLAGLFVVETFLLESQMFDIYIAMDPSLWWNASDLVKNATEQLKLLPSNQMKLWFAGSDAKDIYQNTEQLATILESGAPENLTWTYSPQPDEHHNTIFRATKESAFRWSLWSNQGQTD